MIGRSLRGLRHTVCTAAWADVPPVEDKMQEAGKDSGMAINRRRRGECFAF